MPKFRKKPVVIDAVQYTGGDSLPDVWALQEKSDRTLSGGPNGSLLIGTLEGEMRADVGDWIIKGVSGEIYPCKPGIFAATYEPAD